jgi:lipopolysaccharide export system permease protein
MMKRRAYTTLWGYIAKEFLLSFVVSFLFFFVIFFINQLLLMAEDILERKAPILDVIRLVVYATPAIIAMSFPFGSLVGALMAVGRLSSDNELLVMGSSGVPRSAVMAPLLVLGLFFSLISFYANDYLLPLGTINYGKLYRRLITTAPALELKPYSIKRYRDTTIITGEMKAGAIDDLVILDSPKDGASRVINAGHAELVDSGDSSGIISLILRNVFVQENDPGAPERFEYSTADRMEYNIPLSSFAELGAGISPREMSSVDVAEAIRKKEAALSVRVDSRLNELEEKRSILVREYLLKARENRGVDNSVASLLPLLKTHLNLEARPLKDRSLEIYRLEYYKKFSIPAGALFFVFLAFPLGERARRSGRALGFGVGLLVAVAYWGMLIGGQTLGLRLGFNPFLAMWAPNLVVLGIALPLLFHRRTA